MIKFELGDILRFKRDRQGKRICPSGDYTQITWFREACSFDYNCRFGRSTLFAEDCVFEECCSFGECCTFRKGQSFSNECSFGEYCNFNEECSFGHYCSFGRLCTFENKCSFGVNGKFADHCKFGKQCLFQSGGGFSRGCSFEEGCKFEGYCSLGNDGQISPKCSIDNSFKFGEDCVIRDIEVSGIEEPVGRILKIDRIGSRDGCTYFFKTNTKIYVRCGCFFGTIEEFENEVNKTYPIVGEPYSHEYLETIKYVKAIIL